MTKDVDAVVHGRDLDVVSVETLLEIVREVAAGATGDPGEVEVSDDRAMVSIRMGGTDPQPFVIELLRGRSRPGFLSRSLLVEAARLGERREHVLIYPVEHVITLKAEASLDRAERASRAEAAAQRDPEQREPFLDRARRNRERAEDFRRDVFAHMAAALEGEGINPDRFAQALRHVKRSWRREVASLLDAAAQGKLGLLLD